MRNKVLVGNWKMNNNLEKTKVFLEAIVSKLSQYDFERKEISIAPPFPLLPYFKNTLLKYTAQDCSANNFGAFTGEVSAEILKSIGCSYVILGHSERRQYHNENDILLGKKICRVVENNLKTIFCVGETKEEKGDNKTKSIIKQQLEVLFSNTNKKDNYIIAYEPVWAIGTGKTPTLNEIEEIHSFIRSIVSEKTTYDKANKTPIIYGGSCNTKNASEIFNLENVDGGLVGGASLIAEDFFKIIKALP